MTTENETVILTFSVIDLQTHWSLNIVKPHYLLLSIYHKIQFFEPTAESRAIKSITKRLLEA